METTKTNLLGAKVNQVEISEAAHKVVRGQMAGVIYMTEPTMRKTNNPFIGDCIKVTHISCQVGVDYGNSLENRTGEKQEVEPMRGKHHIDAFIAQADNDPSQYYLCLQKVENGTAKAYYFHKDGTSYSVLETAQLKTFFTEKKESPKQQKMGLFGKAQAKPFQVKLENVLAIKQGCTLYEYQTKFSYA